jgi:hypothetical protein
VNRIEVYWLPAMLPCVSSADSSAVDDVPVLGAVKLE